MDLIKHRFFHTVREELKLMIEVQSLIELYLTFKSRSVVEHFRLISPLIYLNYPTGFFDTVHTCRKLNTKSTKC